MKLSRKHDERSEKWHQDVQETRDWCNETQAQLERMENNGDASNYDELSKRKKELQVVIMQLLLGNYCWKIVEDVRHMY